MRRRTCVGNMAGPVVTHCGVKLVWIAVLSAMWSGVLCAQDNPPPHPDIGQAFIPTDVDWEDAVYSTSFDNQQVLDEWILEGRKYASVVNGKLVLESRPAPKGTEPKRNPNHLVFWLKREVPADFLLEFSLRPQDRSFGLNIVFFNARGRQGQSIFDPVLQPRNGTFNQYHSGDLDNYHISYWAGGRGSSNIRKNHGFNLVGSGKDLVATGPKDAFQTVRIYKRGGKIRLMVDNIVAAGYDDDGQTHGPVHTHSGWIGLRQMGKTIRCEYDKLAVYPLVDIDGDKSEEPPDNSTSSYRQGTYLKHVREWADFLLEHGRDDRETYETRYAGTVPNRLSSSDFGVGI